MAREMNFTGWWEGEVEYYCDNCGKMESFSFECEDEAKAYKNQQKILRKEFGWKVPEIIEGKYHEFCSEKCKNEWIKKNT